MNWTELISGSLSVDSAIRFVSDAAAGGVVIFVGTTRSEVSSNGHELVALDYQAYEEMAQTQLRKLADAARGRWPLIRIAILHRLGRVKVGDASVLIAVSAPHRAEAFAACQWLIDTLKKEAAIWKKEIWSDGSTTWVEGGSQ